MPLPTLPSEILLTIAEQLRLKDVSSLIRSNRVLHFHLLPYLRSIINHEKDKLLIWATRNEKECVVKLLLTGLPESANINYQDSYRNCPIGAAFNTGNRAIIKLLLENGISMHEPVLIDGLDGNPLFHAAYRGFDDIIKMLLDKGADINALGGPGQRRALYYAIIKRHESSVKLLLERGASIGMADNSATVLSYAVITGSESIVELLLEHGASVDSRDGQRDLVPAAVDRGFNGIAKLLVRRGAEITARGQMGWTALRFAVKHSNEDMVRFLLENGAPMEKDVSELEYDDRSPHALRSIDKLIIVAVRNGDEGIVKLLLEYGASVDGSFEEYFDEYSSFYYIMLVSSTRGRGGDSLLRLLLENGPSTYENYPYEVVLGHSIRLGDECLTMSVIENAKKNGYTKNEIRWASILSSVLSNAVENGNERMVKLLLENGAVANSQNQYGAERPKLMVAIEKGLFRIAKLLIDYGGDVNAKDWRGDTTLCWALLWENEAAVRFLLDNGASINCSEELRTPFYWAIHCGMEDVVKLFLEGGAPIDNRGGHSLTMLGYAVDEGQGGCVRLLLEYGAPVDSRQGQENLLIVALTKGFREIAKLLVGKGIDLSMKRSDGWTALQISANMGDVEMVKFFLENGARLDANVMEAYEMVARFSIAG